MKLRNKIVALLAVAAAFLAITSSANANAIGAPRAQVSLDTIPGCSASFVERFDAASRYVQGLPSSRGLSPEAIMRAYWKFTPLCVGEVIRTGGAETGVTSVISGPKAAGQAIPSTVQGLVGDTVRMTAKKRGRTGRSTAFGPCWVTAWAPQWSGGAVRTGAYVNCDTVRAIEIYANTYKLSPNVLINHRSAANSWQQVGIWTTYVNCVPTNSYRGEGIGSVYYNGNYPQAADYSSWFTGSGHC